MGRLWRLLRKDYFEEYASPPFPLCPKPFGTAWAERVLIHEEARIKIGLRGFDTSGI
jgi:hypothetical protein